MNNMQQEIVNDFKKLVDAQLYDVAENVLEKMRNNEMVCTCTFNECENYLEAKLKIQ